MATGQRGNRGLIALVGPSVRTVRRGYDRVVKLALYRRQGVPLYWIIDPAAKTLEVLSLHTDHWRVAATFAADDVVAAAPFPDVSFPLTVLWD